MRISAGGLASGFIAATVPFREGSSPLHRRPQVRAGNPIPFPLSIGGSGHRAAENFALAADAAEAVHSEGRRAPITTARGKEAGNGRGRRRRRRRRCGCERGRRPGHRLDRLEGDLYVFCANESDGIETAHPTHKGFKLSEMKDANGFAFGREIMRMAETGTISEVAYMWPRPGSDTPVQKIAYVTKVTDQICGVGYYK
jgi:hypothetical protein